MPLKIINVAGTRPNFVKIAPLLAAMDLMGGHGDRKLIEPMLVHTGQHYDDNMSDVFFRDLEIPSPDFFLGVGSENHAEQTAETMTAFEKVCIEHRPDLVLVVGDVNSTMACSLAAAKLGIKIAHVEAGLRSFDRTMPEEINRMVTDSLADYLFVTEESGMDNLRGEGVDPKHCFLVGNVMIDSLIKFRKKAQSSGVLSKLGTKNKSYGVVTLHRPSNVDNRDVFEPIVKALERLGEEIPLFFVVHPRTKDQVKRWGFEKRFKDPPVSGPGLYRLDPLGYLDFLRLTESAVMVLTDSGGLQEETTILGVPCITVRNSTERPITVTGGTNILVGTDPARIVEEGMGVLGGRVKTGVIPLLWDGKAAERIVSILIRILCDAEPQRIMDRGCHEHP